MQGHHHNPGATTQNQGNMLGDRSSVRQSKLYRVHEGGNSMKALLGSDHLAWDAEQQQGAYEGRPVYDHTRSDPYSRNQGANRGSNMGMYTNNDFQSSYETTSGGYGHGAKTSPAKNYHDPRMHVQSVGSSRGNRGNNSSGITDSLQPDLQGNTSWNAGRRRDYEEEAPASFPLNKMGGQEPQRPQRDAENAQSLANFANRRGSQAEPRTTRPW